MAGLHKNIRSGIFYTALSKYSSVVTSIIIGAILARLLTPTEFGVVAIISVFITFFNLLSNFGITPAIVQHKSLTDEDISSIFSISIIFGLLLSVIFFFTAPIIAEFYNEPVLINLSQLMSISILFNSLKVVPNAILMKKLKFKELGFINVIVNIISGIISIILAYFDFSFYALVYNSIISALLIFIAYFYLAPIRPAIFIKLSSFLKIAKFSTFQFLFTFINYFATNTDNLLIGKFFSPSALGFYDKSYRLMLMPVQNLTQVITPVLHPVLSEYQDNKIIIYNAYIKIVKLLAIIGFPLSVFLFFNASELITLVYGNQWAQSIPVFKLLALTIGIQIVLSSTGSIFQATNRTDLLFYSGFLSSILMIAGIAYGVFIGKSLIDVGYGLLIAFLINIFQAFYLLVKKSLNNSFLNFIRIFTFPTFLSIGMAFSLFLISKIHIENYLLSLTINSFVSILVFGLILFSSEKNWDFIKEYLTKMIKK
jgi:teichuronic acid exporter